MNPNMKAPGMRLFFLTLFSIGILLSAGCDSDATLNGYADDANITEDEILDLEINASDFGYHYLQTRSIESQSELDSFYTIISAQPDWDDQADFNDTINNAAVDFSAYRIVLMCTRVHASNTVLSPQYPILDGDDNPVISIDETVQTTPIPLMTPYCYAYRVSKNEGYTQMQFNIGERLVETVKF